MADENILQSDLYCWNCIQSRQKYEGPLVRSDEVLIFKGGKLSHLSSTSDTVTKKCYLRVHTFAETRNIKPYRMYCNICKNQVGIIIIADTKFYPSFHHASVVFVSKDGTLYSVGKYKQSFATKTPNVDAKFVQGESKKGEKTFVLDPSKWKDNLKEGHRIIIDEIKEDTNVVFKWDQTKKFYLITGDPTFDIRKLKKKSKKQTKTTVNLKSEKEEIKNKTFLLDGNRYAVVVK